MTVLSFKEMCARFDVTPRTLRYYEYIELISPTREGRSRYYGRREIARMKLILRGRRFGFTLERIRQWLELYDREGLAAQASSFLAAIEERVQAMEAERESISDAVLEIRALERELLDAGYRPSEIDLTALQSEDIQEATG